jgi:hypothetical protein
MPPLQEFEFTAQGVSITITSYHIDTAFEILHNTVKNPHLFTLNQ